MTTPWKTWMRERVPSTTFTWTLTLSPARKSGMSLLRDAESSSSKRCMTDVAFSRPATGHPRVFGNAWFEGCVRRAACWSDRGPGHSPRGGGRRVDGTQRPSLPEVGRAGEIHGCRPVGRAAHLTHRSSQVGCSGGRWDSHLSTRLRSTAYGERVTIDPGLPVALAVVLLLALTVTMYLVGRLPEPGSTLFAAGRAIVQLSIAALVIAAVITSLALSLLLLAFMFVVAVFTTVRRVEAPKAWPWATLAMLAGLLPVVLVILLTRTVPPTGIALVPVVGILAGNTMNGHTLTCRRAFAALREEKGQYEAALSLGLTRSQSVGEVVHRRVPEALIPGLDQVRTAGVVTLPGAFIGVLLGGGSPAQAAAAQVLVLMGIMAAQTTTAVVAERLIGEALLLPDDLKASLQP